MRHHALVADRDDLPAWLLRQMAEDGAAPPSDPRYGTDRWYELMPEYTAPPLWRRGRELWGKSPVSPEELGVPSDLSSRAWRWSDEYTAGGDHFTDDEFVREGETLAQLLADALAVPVEYGDFVAGPRGDDP